GYAARVVFVCELIGFGVETNEDSKLRRRRLWVLRAARAPNINAIVEQFQKSFGAIEVAPCAQQNIFCWRSTGGLELRPSCVAEQLPFPRQVFSRVTMIDSRNVIVSNELID